MKKLKERSRAPGATPLSHLIAQLVDPVLLRKTGMTTSLLASWPEIAGGRFSEWCAPERLVWTSSDEGRSSKLYGATLLVACEPALMLRLQHGSSELIARVNSFFGYPAVDRLRVVPKSAEPPRPSRKPVLRELDADDYRTIAEATANIESARLKAALTKFGKSVLGRNSKPPR